LLQITSLTTGMNPANLNSFVDEGTAITFRITLLFGLVRM